MHKFELDDVVVTPLGKLGNICGETTENGIIRLIVKYRHEDQTVELQPKLLREA